VNSDTAHNPYFPERTETALDRVLDTYARTSRPVEMDFRALVPWIKSSDRSSHIIHPYPAKLLPHIVHFFLANEQMCPRDGIVLDPFSGSGTVGLEAILSGRNAVLFDVNPLARLIAQVKTTPVSEPRMIRAVDRVVARFGAHKSADMPDVVNRDHWYYPHIQDKLARLKRSIMDESSPELRRFLLVCFSVICQRLSLADPRVSVPVRLSAARYVKDSARHLQITRRLNSLKRVDVLNVFIEIAKANTVRVSSLNLLNDALGSAKIAGRDAKQLAGIQRNSKLSDDSVDLVITSPPYGGAQKYVRSSSLSLGWLGLASSAQLRPLEGQTIGREHYLKHEYTTYEPSGIPEADSVLAPIYERYPLRAHIAANYLREMHLACAEISRVLKPGGHAVVVIGNNQVCGQPFLTSQYLATIFQNLGLTLTFEGIDTIRSRGLMTKRNKTASMITCESVLLLTKANTSGRSSFVG
jgi:DNA modification methylase